MSDEGRPTGLVRVRRVAGRVRRRLRPRGRREIEDLRRRLEQSSVAENATERFARQHHRIGVLERETLRIGTQVAAIEARLEDVRQDPRPVTETEGERDPETLAVLDEIRREHQRVRARISAATRYEERLRQLEERVSRLDGAALSEK